MPDTHRPDPSAESADLVETADPAPPSDPAAPTDQTVDATTEPHAKHVASRPTFNRILGWAGALLIASGLCLLGWVGWQMYGTNWVSNQKHASLISEVEKQWKSGESTAKVSEGTVESIVRIPRFGEDYAVPLLAGVSDEALAAGYGWFPDSARVGEKGNFALAAHRVTHGEPLRGMPELQPGDKVIIETADATYTYVMDTGGDDLIVDFSQMWVVDPLPTNPQPGGVQPEQKKGQRLITLTTCSELFHTDNRMIAFGHLESKTPRAS